ncbi:MAG: hypothetical protein EBR87_05880 [Cytophagia bacterium]|nr:hypothetical protein [Cytophagia bacterium]
MVLLQLEQVIVLIHYGEEEKDLEYAQVVQTMVNVGGLKEMQVNVIFNKLIFYLLKNQIYKNYQ